MTTGTSRDYHRFSNCLCTTSTTSDPVRQQDESMQGGCVKFDIAHPHLEKRTAWNPKVTEGQAISRASHPSHCNRYKCPGQVTGWMTKRQASFQFLFLSWRPILAPCHFVFVSTAGLRGSCLAYRPCLDQKLPINWRVYVMGCTVPSLVEACSSRLYSIVLRLRRRPLWVLEKLMYTSFLSSIGCVMSMMSYWAL